MSARVYVDIPGPLRERAIYALGLLFEGVGIGAAIVNDAGVADVVYAAKQPESGALWIPAIECDAWDAVEVLPTDIGGLPFLIPTGAEARQDLVFSTYSYVTGAGEKSLPKDTWGVPIAFHAQFRNFALDRVPVVARYCARLSESLRQHKPETLSDCVERWPNGKRYAVVVSHDVDAPFSSLRPGYLAGRVSKLVGAGQWTALPLAAGAVLKSLLLHAIHARPPAHRDPNLRFADWVSLGRDLGFFPTFYLAVRTAADPSGTAVDVSYDFRHPALLAQLRDAINQGAEIGLHASICARESADRLIEEKAWLEHALGGYRVRGLRHHFWAMDPAVPERTSDLHAAAGFEYDSSLGLNDTRGFRRGMAWPFHPFNREKNRRTPTLQVPPTLMDGGVFYRDVSPQVGETTVREHFRDVFDCGGAAVLDWHMEQMNPTRLRQAGPILVRVLRDLAEDSDIYWTTAAGMAEWWQERRRLIDAGGAVTVNLTDL
jgi:hypothetical protein